MAEDVLHQLEGMAQRRAAVEAEMAELRRGRVEAVQLLITRFGIRRRELNFSKGQSRIVDDAKRTRAVKYIGPRGEKWTGCGRTPKWLKRIEASGGSREAFCVKQAAR